jgi:hypothetical protein
MTCNQHPKPPLFAGHVFSLLRHAFAGDIIGGFAVLNLGRSLLPSTLFRADCSVELWHDHLQINDEIHALREPRA